MHRAASSSVSLDEASINRELAKVRIIENCTANSVTNK